jgi:hypothetical protein
MLCRCLSRTAGLAVLVGALGACGLIDPDVTELDLTLPEKTFQIDTEQWNLDRAGDVVGVSCATMPDSCATAAENLCEKGECVGACGANDQCELTLRVAKVRAVDLQTEKPDLAEIQDSVLDVTIDAIRYEVTDNTLNIATPPFTLYVAPQTVMTPQGADPIGTVPPVAAATTVGRTDVELTGTGRAAVEQRMADFRTPFNIIVGTEIVVRAGEPVPAGKLTAKVTVAAHAGL